MTRPIANEAEHAIAWPMSLPIAVGAAVYALLLLLGDQLLNDPDTYWHVVIGQWIVQHRAVPHVDVFSQTMLGQPWIAHEWLSQLLYAGAYATGGWTAVVVLAAAAIASAFALLTRVLSRQLPALTALVLVTAGVVLASPHLVARPHVLAFPVMVAWVGGLVRALDRARAPSLALLPLMTLWANLHGGFTLGLALLAPIALEAVVNADRPSRRGVAMVWLRFGVLAGIAACVTPYGAESILATYRILHLGEALSTIGEWQPQDFSHLEAFEICLLLALGFALHRGLTMPPVRIAVILGLLHLALSHVRSAELVGLLLPIFAAAPLAQQLGARRGEPRLGGASPHILAIAGSAAVLIAMTSEIAALHRFAPSAQISPAAAVQALKNTNAGPILNDYDFGGYLAYAGIAPFIDGRTEVYGEAFVLRDRRAVSLQNVEDFIGLLEAYHIGATLLRPTTPAVGLLDRLSGWKRVYADDVAVVHVRMRSAAATDAIGIRGGQAP